MLQHTTAALLGAAAVKPRGASANIGGADYVIGGARLSEAITNPEGQIEARLPRDQAEALARAATDYGSIGEAFAAEDGAARGAWTRCRTFSQAVCMNYQQTHPHYHRCGTG